MKLRILILLCSMSFALMASAQASGGQIRRPVKRQSSGISKRSVTPSQEDIKLANYPPDAHYNGERKKIRTIICYKEGEFTITKSQKFLLDSIATMMIENKYLNILIEGYSSMTGISGNEQKLSEQRAVFIQSTLIQKYKIAKDRIIANGMGGTRQMSDEVGTNDVVVFYIVPYKL